MCVRVVCVCPATDQPLFPLWRPLVTPSNKNSSLQIIVGCEDAVICWALCTTVSLSIGTEARGFTLVKVGLVLVCTFVRTMFFSAHKTFYGHAKLARRTNRVESGTQTVTTTACCCDCLHCYAKIHTRPGNGYKRPAQAFTGLVEGK
jgi:hypothetical protein